MRRVGKPCQQCCFGQAGAAQRQLQGHAQALPQHQAPYRQLQRAAEQALQLTDRQRGGTGQFVGRQGPFVQRTDALECFAQARVERAAGPLPQALGQLLRAVAGLLADLCQSATSNAVGSANKVRQGMPWLRMACGCCDGMTTCWPL